MTPYIYVVKSLAGIAEHFRGRAQEALLTERRYMNGPPNARLSRDGRVRLQAEAATWLAAAQFVERTRLEKETTP